MSLPLLVLAGCTNWIDTTPACKLDVYDWSDDLLAHILTGPGDGSFDYDPEDVPRQNLKGRYNYETGDFAWSVTYGGDYWLRSTEVEGYGTAYHNGNLDVLYTEIQTDVLDATWTTSWRVTRTGCSVEAEGVAENAPDGLVRSGTYGSDESYAWEGDYAGYHYSGGMRQNLSRTVGIESDDGTYAEAGTYKPEGTADVDWSGECYDTGYSCEATEHRRFDGGLEDTITIFDRSGEVYAEIVGDYQYSGAGEANWVFSDGTSCDVLTTADGACTYACSDGSDGEC